MNKKYSFLIGLVISVGGIFAQKEPILVDEVTAIIGKNAIYKSDIQMDIEQMTQQGVKVDDEAYCYIIESKLFQSLLVHRADMDSIDVSDSEIDGEIDRRMNYMLRRLGGSEVEFQKFYGKTVLEFKKEIRATIANNLMARKVEGSITGAIKISPSEVKAYYSSIPKDSLPVIPESYKIAQLVVKAKPNAYEKERSKNQLEAVRKIIVNGGDFDLQARIHSEDPGSKDRGGDLGYLSRDQLVPEFSSVAFRLKEGEISEVVESPYGFHIIQMIKKKGKLIHARHILIMPKIYEVDLEIAKERVDSISKVIDSGADFNKLATDLSDDDQSKINGGIVRNPQTGGEYFETEQLDRDLYLTVQQLEKGKASLPTIMTLPDNSKAYRILFLMDKLEFHVASIENDYDRIKSSGLEIKKQKEMKKWVAKHLGDTFIDLPEEYKGCDRLSVWYDNETK
jgi:peptidyl-prolyl cis-trans isomerase SurA